MIKKLTLVLLTALLPLCNTFAQFLVKDTYFETTGISNQGLVAGYETWAGPYSIWAPDAGTTTLIGGMAPGQGVGGQAHFSNDGNYLCGSSEGLTGAELSRYDVANQVWIPSGSLGFPIDNTVSSGYGISGDGNTVVGNSWADTINGFAYTHAVAWNATEGFLDLGSLFASTGRSTRANAVSNDGSVVVGWQDLTGPWKSAVWRKNPAGGYFPNEYLLVDPNGSSTDEFNQLGECSVVSSDGSWIGGYGDFANNYEPWIWSQATGVINLGTLSAGAQGYVFGLNGAGTVAVGRFTVGPWDPELPFIWTATGGLENLNDYVHNTLGLSTGSKKIYAATALSENGQYIAGYGVDTISFAYFTYRVSLFPTSTDQIDNANTQLSISPNPAGDFVALENTGNAVLSLRNTEGRLIRTAAINGNHSLDISDLAAGLYYISLQSSSDSIPRTARFVKK